MKKFLIGYVLGLITHRPVESMFGEPIDNAVKTWDAFQEYRANKDAQAQPGKDTTPPATPNIVVDEETGAHIRVN